MITVNSEDGCWSTVLFDNLVRPHKTNISLTVHSRYHVKSKLYSFHKSHCKRLHQSEKNRTPQQQTHNVMLLAAYCQSQVCDTIKVTKKSLLALFTYLNILEIAKYSLRPIPTYLISKLRCNVSLRTSIHLITFLLATGTQLWILFLTIACPKAFQFVGSEYDESPGLFHAVTCTSS